MSEKELAWLLSPEEKDCVMRKSRGTENRLKYALQICHVKLTGRFIHKWEAVSLKILNYLSQQLELGYIAQTLKSTHKSTESRMKITVKTFLGFQNLNVSKNNAILDFLERHPLLIAQKKDLARKVEAFLVKEKYLLPSKSQVMRAVFREYGKKHKTILEDFASHIQKHHKNFLKSLYDDPEFLTELKTPLGDVIVKNILPKLSLIEKLLDLKLESLPWHMLHPSYSEKLKKLIERYDHSAIVRLRPKTKRDVMLVCYLHESSKILIDKVIQSYDKLMSEIERRVNRDYEKELKRLRHDGRVSGEKALDTLKLLVSHKKRKTLTLDGFCQELDAQDRSLEKIIFDCQRMREFEIYGKSELTKRRYSYLKSFLKKFITLDFRAVKGCESLKKGITLCQDYYKSEEFPKRVPYAFLETPWKKSLFKTRGKLDKRTWEMGLFLSMKKALRSGNLYLPQSRDYRDFWSPLCDKTHWRGSKSSHYKELGLPQKGLDMIASLKKEFKRQLSQAVASFSPGSFAELRQGRLVIHKDPPLEDSPRSQALRSILDAHMPLIRIEDLLSDIQKKWNYRRAFQPIEGFKVRDPLEAHMLNAALTGHATNLGLYGLSRSTEGISVDTLNYISKHFIYHENLTHASNMLIAAQQKYWLTAIIGRGQRSSSDGDRFRIEKRGLLSSMHPRYFGALDRGVTVYTHISDQCSVFGTDVISCGIREAIYVLDGLLDNQSVIKPFEHSTDTSGFTELLFGLCYLLGLSFQPHFKDLKDQQLYCFERNETQWASLFSRERASSELVCEQWDNGVRLAYSLKKNYIKAHVILRKLQNQGLSSKLSKALVHLGRIVKSIYILRYLHDKNLRYAVRKQLNRGEQRHALAKYLFFANQGSFKTNDYEEMMNKASSLSFVSNAIVLWNTEQMQKIYDALKLKGYEMSEDAMSRVLPLSFKHIIVNGTYKFPQIES